MLKENISMLRNVNGYLLEQVAEKIGISRQAYAKWKKATDLPFYFKKIAYLLDLETFLTETYR